MTNMVNFKLHFLTIIKNIYIYTYSYINKIVVFIGVLWIIWADLGRYHKQKQSSVRIVQNSE